MYCVHINHVKGKTNATVALFRSFTMVAVEYSAICCDNSLLPIQLETQHCQQFLLKLHEQNFLLACLSLDGS